MGGDKRLNGIDQEREDFDLSLIVVNVKIILSRLKNTLFMKF